MLGSLLRPYSEYDPDQKSPDTSSEFDIQPMVGNSASGSRGKVAIFTV